MHRIYFAFCLSCLLFSTGLKAESPNGEDLLHACEEASQRGYNNPRGMLCIWYVTPCDCQAGREEKLPRVCLPEDIPHEKLAQTVMKALKEKPALQTLPAATAATNILSPLYPCQD